MQQLDKELMQVRADCQRIKAELEALPAKDRSGALGQTLYAHLQLLSQKAERLDSVSKKRTIYK
jgi:hypothetical protein